MAAHLLSNTSSSCCPVCTNSTVIDRGQLPEILPYTFGDSKVDIFLEAGHLFHCFNCGLYFRYPYVCQPALVKLYKNLPATVWECREPSLQWPFIFKLMQLYSANKTVIDVGCFCGDFLRWLPDDWRKIGIEPNLAARKEALNNGIELIGDTPEELYSTVKEAGVITLLDVLEHVVNPLNFLSRLTKMLAPGGSIIILTGAADTFPWKVFGCDYWYCAIIEHVSFFTLRWFRWASKQLGLSVVQFRYISSLDTNLKESFLSLLRLSIYVAARRLRRFGISEQLLSHLPFFRRATKWPSTPWWREAKDHIIIVLKKQ